MAINGVMVCVDYGDVLAWTLPHNRQHFDRLVVVTRPDDKHTQRICEHYNIERLETDAFHANNTIFNKGAGINEGLKRLGIDKAGPEQFFVQMDSDIVLPPRTKEVLRKIDPDPEAIHGADRLMCTSFDDFQAYLADPEIGIESNMWTRGGAFPLNVRICPMWNDDGYRPVGYFQMWNPAVSGIKTYDEHATAGRGDFTFPKRWARRKRVLIPELFLIHLEPTLPKRMGVNWGGRKTPTFGPGKQTDAKALYPAGDMKLYE